MMPTAHAPHPSPGRTLLALHCSGASGRAFEPYRAWLGPDTALVAPDLLGCGAQDGWALGQPTSLDAEAERLAPLLARGGAEGVHLFGHSYGGAVAMQLALRWPERVASLTLYEPVRFALLRDDPALHARIIDFGRHVGALTLARRFDAAAEAFVDYWSGHGAWQALGPGRQAAAARRMPKVQAEFEALFSDRTPPEAYAALTMPVRLFVGGLSPRPAQRVCERLAGHCAGTHLTRLPGRGHMGALEDPAAVAAQWPWCAPVREAA